MPRILSPTAASAVVAQESGEVFLCLVTLSHPDMTTIRVVNNTEAVTRTDGTYHPYPFEVVLPEDADTAQPTVQMRIDNVSREVTEQLRNLEGAPTCTLSVVLASDPETVEVGPFEFSVLMAQYDALVISVNLGYEEDYLNQAVPGQKYTPTNSAGLFL